MGPCAVDVALTGRTLGMVSPRKDAVAVMDGLAVASMFDALVHTDRACDRGGVTNER